MLHIAGIPFKGYCDMKTEGGGKVICKLIFKEHILKTKEFSRFKFSKNWLFLRNKLFSFLS